MRNNEEMASNAGYLRSVLPVFELSQRILGTRCLLRVGVAFANNHRPMTV